MNVINTVTSSLFNLTGKALQGALTGYVCYGVIGGADRNTAAIVSATMYVSLNVFKKIWLYLASSEPEKLSTKLKVGALCSFIGTCVQIYAYRHFNLIGQNGTALLGIWGLIAWGRFQSLSSTIEAGEGPPSTPEFERECENAITLMNNPLALC